MNLLLVPLITFTIAAARSTTTTTTAHPEKNDSLAEPVFVTESVYATVSSNEGSESNSTTKDTTTAELSRKDNIVADYNSTETANETDTKYVGLRGSIEKEIKYLRTSYEKLRHKTDQWMNKPYHRDVVIPAAIGVASAMAALVVYYIVKASWRKCARKFRRTRLSRFTYDANGEKKRILPTRGEESDPDDL